MFINNIKKNNHISYMNNKIYTKNYVKYYNKTEAGGSDQMAARSNMEMAMGISGMGSGSYGASIGSQYTKGSVHGGSYKQKLPDIYIYKVSISDMSTGTLQTNEPEGFELFSVQYSPAEVNATYRQTVYAIYTFTRIKKNQKMEI